LTTELFERAFSKDLNEMYSDPKIVDQKTKDKILAEALSLTANFKSNIIDFYFTHQGTEVEDNLFDNFELFINSLLVKLEKLKYNKVEYASVALMWTGILTQFERESKMLNDYGLLLTIQHFLMKMFEEQSKYFKSIKT
jgi:hypothetical protein